MKHFTFKLFLLFILLSTRTAFATEISGTANGHDYVDLGLPSGTLWATCNVGADSPEGYGDYFAWGETEPKEEYTSENYNSISDEYLELAHDAANVNWGNNWRMPNVEELEELIENCTSTYTSINGVYGKMLTSNINGKSIFFPFAGFKIDSQTKEIETEGYYWSNLSNTSWEEEYAKVLICTNSSASINNYYYDGGKYIGATIRPVIPKTLNYSISFENNGGNGTMAKLNFSYADKVKIPETSMSKPNYAFTGWNTKADGSGTLYNVGGELTITSDITLYAQWQKQDVSGSLSGHDYVDLGLPSGTLWATCNIGATIPEEYGDYFSWGETEPKERYISAYYTYTDNPITLPLSNDAAYIKWGKKWRMPTSEEQEELRSNCSWKQIYINGVKGHILTGPNGNSIFFPSAGYYRDTEIKELEQSGCSWSSTLNIDYANKADYFKTYNYYGIIVTNDSRVYGLTIRPIVDNNAFSSYTISFNANGGSGEMQSSEVEENTTYIIPSNTFTREGYEFTGWNTKADGTGTSYTEGQTISITANTTLYAQWEEYKISGTANGHDYVDLGLPSGTLWATCNVGADSPEEYGDYFAWGETEPKDEYSLFTYKWCEGSPYTHTKYCTNSDYGTIDNKTILELSDDAANASWGGDWRMPGKEDEYELRAKCTWTWTTQNGVNGYKVTSKTNGNSIFLPAAGYRGNSDLNDAGSRGYYWSSSLSTDFSYNAYSLGFYSSDVSSTGYNRSGGQSVRPVMRVEYTLMFDANGGSGSMSDVELKENESTTIPANTFTRHGYRFIGWNTKADGSGTSYADGETISITANTTLYAQWEERIYESSYIAKSFSISEDKTITFSPGNLQYHIANEEWRFAPSQLDYVGYDNRNINVPSYNGWIDLFGWDTGNNPTNWLYSYDHYTFIDWGTNKIGNDAPNKWRTLTKEEWVYICFDRPNADALMGVAQVDGANGLIILPDNWVCPSEVTFKSGFADEYCIECFGNHQTFSASDWAKLEKTGAVFLPAAGWRSGNSTLNLQNFGGYWASSENESNEAGDFWFYANEKGSIYVDNPTNGISVRLVKDETIQEEVNISGTANGHDYVDLGLPSGTLWATCNVGAGSPEEYGDYFTWGETTTKSTYNWGTYKWMTDGMSSWKGVNRYTFADGHTSGMWYNSYGNFIGDNKITLNLSDDAAYVNWGSSWRMPTKAEQDELRNTSYTTWTWTTQNGVNGYKVTSKTNGNSIFLPAAGYRSGSVLFDADSSGCYWSSSLSTYYSYFAYDLGFDSDNVGSDDFSRSLGQSVRPVLHEIFTLGFDANGGSGSMSAVELEGKASATIPANTFTRHGYRFIGWNTKADGSGTSYADGETISITANTTLYAQWEDANISGSDNGHDYVDLGLPSGTLWATCNVGATSPEGYGDYFAWGETEPKEEYTWKNYKWCNGTSTSFTKYCTTSYYGIVDYRSVLELSDDAAHANWGGDWRMPTWEEQKELLENCTWTWTTQNEVIGYKVVSMINGKSIFLPFTGYYRESENNMKSTVYSGGSGFSIRFDDKSYNISTVTYDCCGYAVRPVRGIKLTYDIRFENNEGLGSMSAKSVKHGELFSIPENTFTRSGYKFIGWNTNADGNGTNYADVEKFSVKSDITFYAQWYKKEDTITHEYVDLGLPSGRKWATMNIGAKSPEDYGYYFAWGETEPKSLYNYTTSTYNGYHAVLQFDNDAAYVNWGMNWRMPTYEDAQELIDYCTTKEVIINNVKGKLLTGPNGNTIFFPYNGYFNQNKKVLYDENGYYWTSRISSDNSGGGIFLAFYSTNEITGERDRLDGLTIRAVLISNTLSFDANGGSGSMSDVELDRNESKNIPANTFTRHGYRFIGWNTKADGTGTSYTEGQTISLTENTTLYAQWEKIIYESSFVARPFSISATETITFSPGNLQYHAANEEWRFAPSQLEYIGEDNANISATYNGWIDLFGWGTGNNPTKNSSQDKDYLTFIDWGVNKIGNDAPNTWRTLTNSEWHYIVFDRNNASSLRGVAKVNDVNGLIILPDSWQCPGGVAFKSGFDEGYCTECYGNYQTISASDWAKLEASGAVFLPAAGYRSGPGIYYIQYYGEFWSASESDSYGAGKFYFSSGGPTISHYRRDSGASVRLVQEYTEPEPTITLIGSQIGNNNQVEIIANCSVTPKSIIWEVRKENGEFYQVENETGTSLTLTPYEDTYTYVRAYMVNKNDEMIEALPIIISTTCKSVVFKDDFGKFTSETARSASQYVGRDYMYVDDCRPLQAEGTYAVLVNPKFAGSSSAPGSDNMNSCNVTPSDRLWYRDTYDHTQGGYKNGTWGGMLMVNADAELVYSREVEVTPYTTMTYSAWAAYAAKPNEDRPEEPSNISFVVKDEDGNLLTRMDLELAYDNTIWKQGKVSFNTENNSKVTIELYNYNRGSVQGNDFLIDDISFSICTEQDVEFIYPIAINFDRNDGTGKVKTEYTLLDEEFNLPYITREGYQLKEWNTNADGTGKSYMSGQSVLFTENITLYAQWVETIIKNNGHEYVDLGLPSGTLWATMNVGATSAEDYGNYYAWGETSPKSTYNWSTYKWCDGDAYSLTKYCTDSYYGTVDNKTTIDPSDDAAYVNWGGAWRMPTQTEQDELRNTNYCTWTWTTQNGVRGYKVTSKINGNSIFMPAAGYRYESISSSVDSYGYNWSSSLSSSTYAYYQYFSSGNNISTNTSYRYYGRTVRAVLTPSLKPVISNLTTPKFAQTYVGESRTATATYTLENASSATASVTGDKAFSIVSQSNGRVQIAFNPTMAGTYTGFLTITTDGNVYKTVEFTATAVLKPAILNLTTPKFTQTYVGESSSATATYTLENATSATATLTGDKAFSIVEQRNGSVQIAFNPTEVGTFNGTLTITTEGNISKSVDFTATALAKPTIISLTAPKFGKVYAGEQAYENATYVVKNANSIVATINGDKAFKIKGQSNGEIIVMFEPTTAGTFNATLTLTLDGIVSSSIEFTATAVLKPVISNLSAPKSVQIYVGESSTLTATYTLENATSATATLTGDKAFSIAKQSNGSVEIIFKPTEAGKFTTTLTITTDDNISNSVSFSSTAVLKPVIADLTTPKFGQVYAGEFANATVTYTLENASSATATLEGDDEFFIKKQSTGEVQIIFMPENAGTFNGTLTITTEGNISKVINFTASAILKPVISITSTPIFEQIYVGETSTTSVTYTLENAENANVTLTGSNVFSITKQSNGSVQIQFKPTSAGTFTGKLIITTDGDISNSVDFTATAVLKPVISNLTTPKFAQTYVGETRTASATYTLENAASATATLTGSSAFSITQQSNGSVYIVFKPTEAGTFNGTLVITTEGNITKSVNFSATAVLKPVITIKSAPKFEQIYVGEFSNVTVAYTLENAENATVTLNGDSEFFIKKQSTGEVQISFAPESAGTFSTVLTITTDYNITKSVSFSATAVLKPVISNLTIPQFAQTYVGETRTVAASYKLENAASATATLTGDKAFSIINQSNGDVQIRFKPTEAGTFNGTLVVTTEGNITKSVSFSATAVLKPVISNLTTPEFAQTYVGETRTATATYILENAASATAKLSGSSAFSIAQQRNGSVQITFKPTEAGTFNGTLVITTEGNITKSVSFSATAVLKPVISNLTTPEFAQTYVGETRTATATYTLENAASATATLTGDKAFSIVKQSNGSVEIAFNPTEAGTFNGTLVITTEGNISKSVSFSATAVLKPVISNLTTPKFAKTYVDESSTAIVTYTLENAKSATATVIGDKGYFSIINQSNGFVEIAFNPAATGTFNGTLTITTEGNVTKSVSFSATAVLKPVISNLTITNFKEIYEGDTSIGIATYKLENASSAKAYITGDKDYFSIVKQSNGLVEVAFSPTQAGTFYGELTIITEGEISNSIRFAATAIPRPAIVDIVVPEIKPIRMGEFASITVTYALKNTNSAFATLNGADEFFIRRQSNGEVMIVFTPYYPGTFSTVLTIETEEKISVDIELTATAIADVTTSIDETSDLNIYAKEGTIYCDEEFKIYTVAGLDVTFLNGSLQGVYVVTTEKGNKQVSVW